MAVLKSSLFGAVLQKSTREGYMQCIFYFKGEFCYSSYTICQISLVDALTKLK